MKCAKCGAVMEKTKTDLPFKIGPHSIIIVKDVPVYQCSKCIEYEIEDAIMVKIERILDSIDMSTELEVVRFAA